MKSHFEFKGEWFLPSNTENRIFGVLSFKPNESAELELFGSFSNSILLEDSNANDLILGLTSDSKLITLYKSFVTRRSSTNFVTEQETGTPTTTYTVNYILVGAHVLKVQDLYFNKVVSDIHNLEEWVGLSGFDMKIDIEKRKKHEYNINYKLPEPIDFLIEEKVKGKLNFTAKTPSFSRYQKSAAVTQNIQLIIETNEEKELTELLDYSYKFQNFLVLALYESTHPISITLYGEKFKETFGGKEYRKKIEFYAVIRNSIKKSKPKHDLEMLFYYYAIKDDFEKIIKNWYKNYSLLAPAFNLVFEQLYNKSRFSENNFLNLAQAAETFHARLHNHTKLPRDVYKKMKEEILSASPAKHHDWLNNQFNFGNNLNLHQRLVEIVEKYSNPIIDKMLGDKETFIKNIKHSRNYYTHYSKKGEKKALKGIELYRLSEKLKILLVCAILEECGIKKEILVKLLDNVKWKYFNHITDWKK